MDKQYEIDLLCFLIEAKKNKPFYKAHKPDIDFFIKVVKASINSESKKPIKEKKKIGVSEIGPYIIPIIHLIAELGHFLNSS
jgi:Holliday junction resolvase RusA-like endonuclease